MKFCYLDESGMGSEPILVMAGIMVDCQRMHVTKDVWADFLSRLSNVAKKTIPEFHTKDFYNGNGPWRGIDGQTRSNIISSILDWVGERKHKVTFNALRKDEFGRMVQAKALPAELNSQWLTVAVHSILSLQKHNQREEKTKGHTVLIFDREMKEEERLTGFVHRPPSWIDSFYGRGKKENSLSQIVDVPFFADSKPVLLIQVADLIAYLLREFAEVASGLRAETFAGETDKLAKWAVRIAELSLPTSTRYPSKGRCSTAQLFWTLAPECIRTL